MKYFGLIVFGFSISFVAIAQPNTPLNNPYPEYIEAEKEAMPVMQIREADVFWKKRLWRRIMMNEKFNLKFQYNSQLYNATNKEAIPFITFIRQKALNGEITMYSDEDFNEEIPNDKIDALFGFRSKIQRPDPITGDLVDTIIIEEHDVQDCYALRLKEDWFFDETHGKMRVQILAIGFDYIARGENGSVAGKFWVYYPAIRKYLAKEYVYNEGNDAIRATYDDVFESRMFTSYIYKESNVFERQISGDPEVVGGYRTGVKALVEGESIKNDIFKREQYMWSY